MPSKRTRNLQIAIEGEEIAVKIIETPFREGVEVECEFRGRRFRVSDHQLGEREAMRLLTEELKHFLSSADKEGTE
jgi:hypothetical protein